MSVITLTKEKCGNIRELHGVNCTPHGRASGVNQPLTGKIFKYCGIPYTRLHDCMGAYGGCYYIDVPNIFRDFDADENDPASYDFHYSDEYIKAIINTGSKIIYRLGVTIEQAIVSEIILSCDDSSVFYTVIYDDANVIGEYLL